MNRIQQVFDELNSLLLDIKNIDPKMFEYGISFNLKIFGFQELHIRTLATAKELEAVQKEESALAKATNPLSFKETDRAYKKTVAYFEAYLNALYSLLQVVTKITLLIYQKSKKTVATNKMGDNFGSRAR